MLLNNNNFLCSWSGGKDSCYALMKAIELGYTPRTLLNVLNEDGKISRSHGIPKNILQAQANAINLPIHLIESSWNDYESNFTNALKALTKQFDLSYAVFGDIDLQAHKDWEEKVCYNANLKAVLPLWQNDRKQLLLQMLDAGIKTMIVSCNDTMGANFLGKIITRNTIAELEQLNIDVCGENGEFHTLVLNCPLFLQEISVAVIEKIQHNNYWFCNLKLL